MISDERMSQTAEIVSAYVSQNAVPQSELPALIHSVHAVLTRLASGFVDVSASAPETLIPAVSIRKSVTPAFIICLEDGKRFKSMRRHLINLGLTPDAYRKKWNLPSDYPMVAPNYAAQRSELAKKIGLGAKKVVEEVVEEKPRRGRKAKVVEEVA